MNLTNSGSSVVEKVSYVLTDHLGSVDDVQGSTSAARPLEVPGGGGGRKPGATNVALVDLNGRVYDPEVGRFLSPDPNVQYPESSQGYDRYRYVNDNPLSLSDPSGYFSTDAVLGVVAAIVVDWACYGTCTGMTTAFLSGAAGGFVGSGGNLQTGVESGLEAMAFNFAGDHIGWGTTAGDLFAKSTVEGLVGGAFSEAGGGRFSDGFLGAFSSSELSPVIGGIGGTTNSVGYYSAAAISMRVVVSAVVGGTVSSMTGGDFGDGAVAAAMQRLYNDELNAELHRKAMAALKNIIHPGLRALGASLDTKNAEMMVLGTGIQESGLTNERQVNCSGADCGLGMFQVQPSTARDIFNNFLASRPALMERVLTLESACEVDPSTELMTNEPYAAALVRIFYSRVRAPLPSYTNPNSMAQYWKNYYNTGLGSGTASEFVNNWNNYMGPP